MSLTKEEIEKNILDLQYQRHLQKFNALLIFSTTGIISLISAIVFSEFFWYGLALALIILSLVIFYYLKFLNAEMNNTILGLSNLKNKLKS